MTSHLFSIKYRDIEREPSAHYEHEIFSGTELVAIYWHDFRGDDHGIEFVNGIEENSPTGLMTEFIIGGGPKPLALSKAAREYIADKLRTVK